MNNSTVESAHEDATAMESQPPAKIQAEPNFLLVGLRAVASLKVTVVLFVLSFILVFVGTLAQMDAGIQSVVSQYFRSFYVWVPFQLFVRLNQVFLNLSKTLVIPGAFPFLGGKTLGILLLVNLLAAHAIRFKLTARRMGIIVLHVGLILMMVGEFVTGEYAVEGRMTIEEGHSANFVEQHDSTELAIVDLSKPDEDQVVVVPDRLLQTNNRIEHAGLPFDVQLEGWMKNSTEPKPPRPADVNPATAGSGLKVVAEVLPEVSGTNPDQKVDVPAAYVSFYKKGTDEKIGTWLVSLWLTIYDLPQRFEYDGKTYDLSLRFKRAYKSYTMKLLEFKHEKYMKTDIPRNYSSLVRLEDPSRHQDREFLIYMNQPMRYAGETFYQADFLKDGRKGTVLQVVRNPGWLLPYFSCTLVTLGMLLHFGQHLAQFLRLRAAK